MAIRERLVQRFRANTDWSAEYWRFLLGYLFWPPSAWHATEALALNRLSFLRRASWLVYGCPKLLTIVTLVCILIWSLLSGARLLSFVLVGPIFTGIAVVLLRTQLVYIARKRSVS